jgi:hypothetical protein
MLIIKKVTLSFFAIILIGLVITSCEDDNPITSNPDDLIGSWTRTVTDSEGVQFDAKIVFDANSYDFIVLTNTPGHTDSHADYVIENGMIKIINDADCYDIGYYNFSVVGNNLTLTSFEDMCEGRRIALQGVWTRM